MIDEWDEVIESKPYSVTAEDYVEAILATRRSKISVVLQWVETALVLGMLAVCISDCVNNGLDLIRAGLLLACGLLMCAVWLLPRMSVQSVARDLVRVEYFSATVEPDWVTLRHGDGEWQIALDDTTCFHETKSLFLLEEENHHFALLRKDAFDDPDLVRTMLQANTVSIQK